MKKKKIKMNKKTMILASILAVIIIVVGFVIADELKYEVDKGYHEITDMDEGRATYMEEEEECERIPDEKMGCMAGRSSFWLTWDGRMTPCGMMNEPVARPFEEGFDLAWKKITEETNKILLPAECRECKKRFACMVCGALCIAEGYGCSYKKPEYLCRQTEVFLEEMEKEYQRLLEKGKTEE